MNSRMILCMGLMLALGACSEARFESPPGDKIESCDARWKGLWVDDSDNARKDKEDELAFLVDDACRFQMIERPEKDGPPKLIHVPLNFVHDRGKDYLVIADDQLGGVVELDPPHGIDPAPKKSYFLARYRIDGDHLEVAGVDATRVAHLILDKTLEGTIDYSKKELHTYVRGNDTQILDVVRKQEIFESPPSTRVRRIPMSLEEHERKRAATHKGSSS